MGLWVPGEAACTNPDASTIAETKRTASINGFALYRRLVASMACDVLMLPSFVCGAAGMC